MRFSSSKYLRTAFAALLTQLALFPAVTTATGPEGGALGDAFRISTDSNSSQLASVARAPNGDFVVVWTGIAPGNEVPDYDIYARRYSADGRPLGGEFRVNTETSGFQASGRSIGIDRQGNFVIAWSAAGPLDGRGDIKARRYRSNGTPLGPEFLVNSTATGTQSDPVLAMHADGSFVAAWVQSMNGGYYDVYARRFNADGTANGGDFLVNTFTDEHQDALAIALDAAGNFVIAWQSHAQDLPNGAAPYEDGRGVYARRFGANGAPLTSEIRVAESVMGVQGAPSIGMAVDGRFTIAWDGAGNTGDGEDIFARQFDATGTPLGGEFRVNSDSAGKQLGPTVAMDARGGFSVAWGSYDNGGRAQIYARRFSALGLADGNDFRVDSDIGRAERPGVASTDADGDLISVWETRYFDGTDYVVQVFGRRFRGPEPIDLGLDLVRDVLAVAPGATFDVTVQTESGHESDSITGIGAGSGITVDIDLPAGASFVSANSSTSWTCSGSTDVSCAYRKTLDASAKSTPLKLTLRAPSSEGTVSLGSLVTADQLDPSAANNRRSAQFTVAAGADSVPSPFPFTPKSGVMLDTVVTSDPVTLSGMTHGASISIQGGSYSINGGAFTSAVGVVNPGATIRARVRSADLTGSSKNATLSIGGVTSSFTVTTTSAPSPAAFSFASQSNVPVGALVTSQQVTLTGLSAETDISVTGGHYSVNNGPWSSAPGRIAPNSTLSLRHTAASNPSTTRTTTVAVGGRLATFQSTTAPASVDSTPDAFAFTNQTGVARSSTVTSEAIVLKGMTGSAAIKVTGGSYSINGAAFTAAAGVVPPGAQVRVRHKSAATANATTNTQLTVGGVSGGFTSTTAQ